MSFVIVQTPISPSYSSMVADIILSSNENVSFELMIGTDTILNEFYSPDANGMIYIRDLGKVCRDYLPGAVLQNDGVQHDVSKTFVARINGSAQLITFDVQRCDAYTTTTRSVLTSGALKRLTHKNGIEFLTAYLAATDTVTVKLLKCVGSELVASDEQTLYTPAVVGIHTLTTSFWKIQTKYTGWDYAATDGYRIKIGASIEVDYLLDYADYAVINYFLYKNVFGVSETLTVVPDVKQKIAVTSDTGIFNNERKRMNVRRADVFEVNVGALRTTDEYVRLRELFGSDEAYIFVDGGWLPIVLTDVKDENSPLLGLVTPISFSYQYANDKHANRL